MSISTENFLKAVYRLSMMPDGNTKPGRLANELGISNAAATDMSRNLASKDLIHYEKYRELKLTDKGKQEAIHLVRKHRLWETLLFQLFDINLGEIHREAELLEHQTSDFLAEKMSDYLGNPEFDPHGDPIPSREGKIQLKHSYVPLSRAKEGLSYTIKRLFSSDDAFFQFCESNGLNINAKLILEKQYPSSEMTLIKTESTKIILNSNFANNIYVTQ